MTPLNVIYQDEHLVAVHKPSGLLVHRSALARGETEFLLQRLRNQLGRRVYPVHRLDRPTSGVMVLALSSAVAGMLSDAFSERQVDKRYLAVVRGKAPKRAPGLPTTRRGRYAPQGGNARHAGDDRYPPTG